MKRILHVTAGVRYWEDTKIDGVADIGIDELAKDETAKPRMPFAVERKFSKSNEYDWDIKIDVDEGVIIGWSDFNVSASTHYKVCDECEIRYYVDDRLMCHYEGYLPCQTAVGMTVTMLCWTLTKTGKSAIGILQLLRIGLKMSATEKILNTEQMK